MNQFTELYKTLPTDELLDIIDQAQDYQPLAVDAAKAEIESRKLSPELLEAAKAVQQRRLQAKIEAAEKAQARFNEIKNAANKISDVLNPIQTTTYNSDKLILRITIWFGIVTLYTFVKEFGFLQFIVSMGKWDVSAVLIVLPIIILPIGSILFWFRKKVGWFILTAFSAYIVIGIIPTIAMWVTYKPSGIAALDNLNTIIYPVGSIISVIIFGQVIWYLCKADMRAIYKADKMLLFIAIGVGASVPLGFLFSLL